MSRQLENVTVATLKEQLEQLFPGKWLTGGGDGNRALLTGIKEFDSLALGLSRRKVSEWLGLPSSGKTTFLRAMIARWCASGLNVVYVDTFSRLMPSDWAFVRQGLCGAMPLNMMHRTVNDSRRGQFLAIRVSECRGELEESKQKLETSENDIKDIKQKACWVVEQLLRSRIFDVIVFDQAELSLLSDRIYARLNRALERSKTALIVMKDTRLPVRGMSSGHTSGLRDMSTLRETKAQIKNSELSNNRSLPVGSASTWGCHTRVSFAWSANISYEKSISDGIASIVPGVTCSISRDGLKQEMEGQLASHVQNRLFTHSQIPDRRTSKTRAHSQGKTISASR